MIADRVGTVLRDVMVIAETDICSIMTTLGQLMTESHHTPGSDRHVHWS